MLLRAKGWPQDPSRSMGLVLLYRLHQTPPPPPPSPHFLACGCSPEGPSQEGYPSRARPHPPLTLALGTLPPSYPQSPHSSNPPPSPLPHLSPHLPTSPHVPDEIASRLLRGLGGAGLMVAVCLNGLLYRSDHFDVQIGVGGGSPTRGGSRGLLNLGLGGNQYAILNLSFWLVFCLS